MEPSVLKESGWLVAVRAVVAAPAEPCAQARRRHHRLLRGLQTLPRGQGQRRPRARPQPALSNRARAPRATQQTPERRRHARGEAASVAQAVGLLRQGPRPGLACGSQPACSGQRPGQHAASLH
eukprot:8483031-Pyramimonas_sp.AAC.2